MKEDKNDKQLEKVRHSLSHLMTMAIMEIYPKAGLGVGPAIENGFYQDYDLGKYVISNEDFSNIESKMRELIAKEIKFEQHDVTFAKALAFYKKDKYKTELIKELKKKGEKNVSFYKSGEFDNLCAGPHVKNTKEINPQAFKLTKVAGAYWRGDEKNKMLTRIYGVAFNTKEELDSFVKMQEEAERRDHRKLGKELDLFIFSELIGPGLPIYAPKGKIILDEIRKFINSLQNKIGYQEVQSPCINRGELFKVSGHYDKYKDDMLKVFSHYTKEEYFLKPMSCPQHTQLYASKQRSYKDLPLRISDFGHIHRDEKPGELSGLTRLRGFHQDDGHCFCTEEQIKEEFKAILLAIKEAMQTFGMNYQMRLSLWDPKHPEKYLGEAKTWKMSQKMLEEILTENKIDHIKAEGEAAIYGPKMDLISKDSLGREWQLSTIQLDFIMPERFGLKYIASDGKEKTPVMIHRAIVGSPERFFGVLIEHYAGIFPTWLSPVQVSIIPISEKHLEYANEINKKMQNAGVRTQMQDEAETLGKKIRTAETQKIPYLLILGDKEIVANAAAVRARGKGDLGQMPVEKFVEKISEEIKNKI